MYKSDDITILKSLNHSNYKRPEFLPSGKPGELHYHTGSKFAKLKVILPLCFKYQQQTKYMAVEHNLLV